ncbi:Response regulator receiver domain-containing protein [Salinimicrobium catena]|uniref:Response regulator receiver domain-containing protein n=1 Tax=Salinimicrobium catena TaxID=390640 RepID=A0A1H5JRQ0_9FLAO|nr:response regulator [Salinimicrobium catena]SDK89287.1 Response regulator receiver domain-containing protein [Salinimicrobium catena]SEE54631.1 Response regulator receiver domain-containing protein [Salinimicrobium catena]
MNTDVVIIDDDAVVLFLHKILVEKSPLSSALFCFDNGNDAYSYLCNRTTNEPLLVLLDINMPGMSGWDLLDKISQEQCDNNVWVVMVTSSINSSDKERAAKYSRVIEYLEKPLSKEACETLHSRVQHLLHS